MSHILVMPHDRYTADSLTAILPHDYETDHFPGAPLDQQVDAPWDIRLENFFRGNGLLLAGAGLLKLGWAAQAARECMEDATLYRSLPSTNFIPEVDADILDAIENAPVDDASKTDPAAAVKVGIMATAVADGIRHHIAHNQVIERVVPVYGTTRSYMSYTVNGTVDPRSNALLSPGSGPAKAEDITKTIKLMTGTTALTEYPAHDFQLTSVVTEYESGAFASFNVDMTSNLTDGQRVITIDSDGSEFVGAVESGFRRLDINLPGPEDGLRAMARLLLLQKYAQC